MADTFDPDSMDQTPRYGIRYPAPDNLVRQAPEQFETMATDIEGALANVDDRATDAARATIVMPTLDQLETSTPVQGQLGYVYDDPAQDQNGLYVWTGSSTETGQWAKLSSGTTLTIISPTYQALQAHTEVSAGSIGLVTDDPQANNNVTYIYDGQAWQRIPGDTGQTIVVDTWDQLRAQAGTLGQVATITDDPAEYNRTAAVNTGLPSNWQRLQAMPEGLPIDNPQIKLNNANGTIKSQLLTLKFDNLVRFYGEMQGEFTTSNPSSYSTVTLVITLPGVTTVKGCYGIAGTITLEDNQNRAQYEQTVALDSLYPTFSGNTITYKHTWPKQPTSSNKNVTVAIDLSGAVVGVL